MRNLCVSETAGEELTAVAVPSLKDNSSPQSYQNAAKLAEEPQLTHRSAESSPARDNNNPVEHFRQSRAGAISVDESRPDSSKLINTLTAEKSSSSRAVLPSKKAQPAPVPEVDGASVDAGVIAATVAVKWQSRAVGVIKLEYNQS